MTQTMRLMLVPVLVAATGCAAPGSSRDSVQAWPHDRAAAPAPGDSGSSPAAGRAEPQTQAAPVSPAPAPPDPAPPDPEDVARATQLVHQGTALYRKGSYDEAERTLKQAMALYPFVAEGNLTLGKILLIRGAAARDPAMIESARLMFEMARAMDGDSREAEMLLELFHSVPE